MAVTRFGHTITTFLLFMYCSQVYISRLYYCTNALRKNVMTTIDINLPELEHVADHLKPTECRNLVVLLHGSNPSFPNFIIPENKTCLELLVQWNSSPGLGRGQSHDVLTTKLHQLGHHNLSRWLSREVFHQLAADVNASLVIVTSAPSGGTSVAVERKQEGSRDDEVVLSSLDITLSSILLVTSIFLIVVALISLVKCCAKKMKVKRKGPYKMLPDAERLHESLILIE